ncbi:hypothetical protein Cgig2_014914 [Carnegiea gigantea]|uniref:Uncharacterized protein n=1 Tax=Carnegiea gigantea TaxID=171969 RepID=A0A9Q1GLC6_9CARY|nr:hypothetical protein Cgig2_014914 [Carnegiea gigantea]
MTIVRSSGAESSSTSFASEIDSVAPNLATQPTVEEMSGEDEFGYNSAMELDARVGKIAFEARDSSNVCKMEAAKFIKERMVATMHFKRESPSPVGSSGVHDNPWQQKIRADGLQVSPSFAHPWLSLISSTLTHFPGAPSFVGSSCLHDKPMQQNILADGLQISPYFAHP